MATRDRFRFCADPKCAALFLARGPQAYCHPRCSQAVRTRTYRGEVRAPQETEAAEKRERFRRSRREAYKQKLRRGGMKVQEYGRREL